MHNLYEILEQRRDSEALAVVDRGRRCSYAQLHRLVEAVDVGAVPSGPNIGLLLPNSLEYIVGYFSILHAGKVVVPINPNSTAAEIERDVDLCQITTIFADHDTLPKVRGVAALEHLLVLENLGAGGAGPGRGWPGRPPGPNPLVSGDARRAANAVVLPALLGG